MTRPVYSTQFILGEFTGVSPAYVVPEGNVAVIRCVDISIGEAATDAIIGIQAGGQFVWVVQPVEAGGFGTAGWRGHLVLNPGQELSLFASGDYRGHASGYLLTQ